MKSDATWVTEVFSETSALTLTHKIVVSLPGLLAFNCNGEFHDIARYNLEQLKFKIGWRYISITSLIIFGIGGAIKVLKIKTTIKLNRK